MASQFPAFIAYGGGDTTTFPTIIQGEVDVTSVAQTGEFVYETASLVEECGVNPTLILGLILGEAPQSKRQLANNKPQPYFTTSTYQLTPIAALSADTVVGLSSATTPSEANRFVQYGITLLTVNSFWNYWQLDTTKTGGTARCTVIDYDAVNGIFYVRFLPQYLQGQSVQS